MSRILFFKTTIGEEEKAAISQVIDSGWLVMGKKTQEFEEKFAEYVGAKHAIFVDSGTSALFLALQLAKQKGLPRDILVPSLTFTSTAEVVKHVVNEDLYKDFPYGLTFTDVDRKTFCVDNDKTGNVGVIPVHLTGNRAKSKNNVLLYDSAHRIEKDDLIGETVPWCYSFYATKNLSTVQGGMIAVNDDEDAKWLRAARDHGISKGTLERYTQKTPTYSIDFVGWRVKGDDLRAAIGLEQLRKLPQMTQRRNEIVARYNANLGLSRTGNHLYPILVSNREDFFGHMETADIQCSVHFLPLHNMPAYRKTERDQYYKMTLPNTEYLGQHLVSIPLFPDMTDEQVDYVSEQVLRTGLLINE